MNIVKNNFGRSTHFMSVTLNVIANIQRKLINSSLEHFRLGKWTICVGWKKFTKKVWDDWCNWVVAHLPRWVDDVPRLVPSREQGSYPAKLNLNVCNYPPEYTRLMAIEQRAPRWENIQTQTANFTENMGEKIPLYVQMVRKNKGWVNKHRLCPILVPLCFHPTFQDIHLCCPSAGAVGRVDISPVTLNNKMLVARVTGGEGVKHGQCSLSISGPFFIYDCL